MTITGSQKGVKLDCVPVDDHGFLDFCFFVIRNHQLHVSFMLKNKKDIKTNEVCEEVKNPHVKVMECKSESELCNCLENLFLSSTNLCFENLCDFLCRENPSASAMAATVTAESKSTRQTLSIREKFDSAASQNFYGSRDCLKVISEDSEPIFIEGFTGNHQAVSRESGINRDGKHSFYVRGMPKELALLSAYLYVQDGAAILLPSDGVVVKLSQEELKKLKAFIVQFEEVFKLKVVNNTYEVVRTNEQSSNIEPSHQQKDYPIAMSSTSTKFFNTKVNVANSTQRILTLLLTGLSFEDIYNMVKYQSASGLPPDLTMSQLNAFSHQFGRTPDILRLATAQQIPNQRGLMEASSKPTFVGARFEVDIMDTDYNDPSSKKGAKLPTWGGALCAAVGVDCFSGYVIGKLLKAKSNTVEFLKEFVQYYQLQGHTIKLLASDSGIVSMSKFQVMTSESLKYLMEEGIATERAEPNNHERGTPTVERTIRMVKELSNVAIIFLLRNPNFHELGFDIVDIYKLWGELFFWSITMINLKPSPQDKSKTRFEVFHGFKPNLQRIRTLPIFSIIMILQKATPAKDFLSNKLVHRPALYVGPSQDTPGAIRAALKTPGSKNGV